MTTCLSCGKPTKEKHHKLCQECYQKAHSSTSSTSSRSSLAHSPKGLPEKYLEDGYFNEKGFLREECITIHPKQIAQAFERQKIKVTALRKFFNKIKLMSRKFNLHENYTFDMALPEILELEPYAAYTVNRGVMPAIFLEFITRNLAHAKTDKHAFCDGFVKHLEYVVAYFPRQ